MHTLWDIWLWITPFILIWVGANSARRVFFHWDEEGKWSRGLFLVSMLWVPLGLLDLYGKIYLAWPQISHTVTH
jgi:hypothetical protein